MPCNGCGVQFTIVTWKHPCRDCGLNHCNQCLIGGSQSSSISNLLSNNNCRRCSKCHLLFTGNFTRKDLLLFQIKDLRVFLRRHRIPIDHCTEKNDLVELALIYSKNAVHLEEERQHLQHVQALWERRRQSENAEAIANLSSQVSNDVETTAPVASGPNTEIEAADDLSHSRSEQTPQSNNLSETFINCPEGNHSSSIEAPIDVPTTTASVTQTIDMLSTSNSESSDLNLASANVSNQSTVHQPSQSSNSVSNTNKKNEFGKEQIVNRAKLSDIHSVESIEEMNIKQLKEILVCNFVDFKGCCEKQELVDRVKRLWKNKQTTLGAVSDEDNLCKICMDSPIDCVLLDCGHMLSCTQCGKQLSECPLCRQYIVRVVHTFRA